MTTRTIWLKRKGEQEVAIHEIESQNSKERPIMGVGVGIYDIQVEGRKVFVLYLRNSTLTVDIVDLNGAQPKHETLELGSMEGGFHAFRRKAQIVLIRDGFLCLVEGHTTPGYHNLEMFMAEKNEDKWKTRRWKNDSEDWKPEK